MLARPVIHGARCARRLPLGWVVGFWALSAPSFLPPSFRHSPGSSIPPVPAVLVAGTDHGHPGLIDDRWGLDALTKFAGGITAASVLVTMGVAWSVLHRWVVWRPLDRRLSILLTPGAEPFQSSNAVNSSAGLDRLAAGLGYD